MTAVAYGIAMPASRGILSSVPYCQPAVAFFQRLATQPSTARKALYNALISSLVSAGVWSKLDALYMFAAADQATALVNLVQSSYGATAVSAPAFTSDQGFSGASGKYVDSNFNPSTAAGKFQQDNASIFAWGALVGANAGETIGTTTTPRVEILPRYTGGDVWYLGLNGGETAVSGTQSDGSGFRALSRSSGTTVAAYNAATLVSNVTSASTGLPASDILLLHGVNGYYTGTVYCGGFGSSLTQADVTALYNTLYAYLQSVSGLP